MKELSIEEKTNDSNYKAYTELINRLEDMKDAIKKQNFGIAMSILCKPYPQFQVITHSELKESEDERIRKWLIGYFNQYIIDGMPQVFGSGLNVKDVIAWLEKQGEQNYKIIKGKNYFCVKTHNYAGIEWIKGTKYYASDNYTLVNQGCECYCPEYSKEEHNNLFEEVKYDGCVEKQGEQKPAELSEEIPTDLKDIVDKEANAIWKEESTDGCHLVIDSFNMFYGICMQIAEAVVDYKKPAWSEEDEKVIHCLEYTVKHFYEDEDTIKWCCDWLKSLKDKVQPKQEWSEEEIENCAREAEDNNCIILAKHIRQLKSLRPHGRWKPSDEQIEALWSATEKYLESDNENVRKLRGEVLGSLYVDLKKLK